MLVQLLLLLFEPNSPLLPHRSSHSLLTDPIAIGGTLSKMDVGRYESLDPDSKANGAAKYPADSQLCVKTQAPQSAVALLRHVRLSLRRPEL